MMGKFDEAPLNYGSTEISIMFDYPLIDNNYTLSLVMMNQIDFHPQIQPMIIVSKDSWGFKVKWGSPIDSGNYRLSYLVMHKSAFSTPTPPPFVPKEEDSSDALDALKYIAGSIPFKVDPNMPPDEAKFGDVTIKNIKLPCWNHEWKRYDGLMDSFDYCIHCDEKKRK